MPSSDSLTIRLSPELKDRLGQLADKTRRSRSHLAAEALADYVAREFVAVDGIQLGLEDARADRLIDHDEAMAELDEVIAAAERKRTG